MARQISKKFVEEPGTSTRSRKQAGAGCINELEATQGGETSPPTKRRHLRPSLTKFPTSRPAYITKVPAKQQKKVKK
jgi:hypothetical protein